VSVSAWEFIFMMLVLKLPIFYLVGVVWWAVRAQPGPYEAAALVPATPEPEPDPPQACTWRAHLPPRAPRGAPSRARTRARPATMAARR
jgi:hypothetical protein